MGAAAGLEQLLNEVVKIIHRNPLYPSSAQDKTVTEISLEVALQARTEVLVADNTLLQRQIRDLSQEVQERIDDISRLNAFLKEQIHENKQTQAAEREQRLLMEAWRDTIATMSIISIGNRMRWNRARLIVLVRVAVSQG